MEDQNTQILFEGTFFIDGYAAKADMLKRNGNAWQMIEVKSGVNDKKEFTDDMAYTSMIINHCGFSVSAVSLMLLSKDFRMGMSNEKLFIEIDHTDEVLKKIDYQDLTATSKSLIQSILEAEVLNFEEQFINFYNNSTSITPRMHSLKLLPGIGQKHMWEIIEARQRQKFVTFKDIADRTSVAHPEKQVALRIIKELQREGIKYYLFSKTKQYE